MRMALAVTALLAVSHASYANTIVDLAVATPDLSTLVAALKAADLVDTLSGPGPFTVFAPTNEAFAALPKALLDSLLEPRNKAILVKLLTYHVVAADIPSSQLVDGEGIKTVEGDYVNASVGRSSIKINQARVISADNKASNGVVHIIDGVLTYPGFAPPAVVTIVDLAVATPELSTLVAALKAADLVDTLSGKGPFTVFAPTNKAFAALPAGLLDSLLLPVNKKLLVALLKYHVVAAEVHAADILDGSRIKTVEGDTVMAAVSKSGIKINQATVTAADNDASNGVVHIIDAVLTYPGFAPPAVKTIVDLAVATPELSTLVAALKAADLVDTLSGAGPFTVFAPTNKAFASLPVALLNSLLLPANKATLVKVLTYHVVPVDVYAKDILDGEGIKTVEGDKVMAAVSSAGIQINQATVTSANNYATNGVVHIIDAVLTYPGFAPPPSAPLTDIFALVQQSPELSILASLLKDAKLNGTLAGKGPYTLFAPTDAVFKQKIRQGSLDCLPHAAILPQLLELHVLSNATVLSKLITADVQGFQTVEGTVLPLKKENGIVSIEGYVPINNYNTKVTSADNLATNGVVHIIDNVLNRRPGSDPFKIPKSC